ncbi:MAG: winged helix-turn-helix transcriptional regulator [Lachnospiraceae bacterium]|nr:winged helix-turn-helix transcriptional regulator [Lachnospiraceae bacterium]
MEEQNQRLITALNRAVIQYRGIYSAWSKKHNLSYNEMLVLYTIRDERFCTQKQICDSYLLPRQTMNYVFLKMRKEGLLVMDAAHSAGREKAFTLTEKGRAYAEPFLSSLNHVEARAEELMGRKKIEAMTALLREFDEALDKALKEND